jgi:hypothetical protein
MPSRPSRQPGGDAFEQAVKSELEPLVPGVFRVRVNVFVEHPDEVIELSRGC